MREGGRGDETGDFSALGAVDVPALALGFWEDDDFEGCCGEDLVLLRGVGSCGSALPRRSHSGFDNDNVRVRVRDNGGDDGTGDSVLGGGTTGAGGVLSATCGGGPEGGVVPSVS